MYICLWTQTRYDDNCNREGKGIRDPGSRTEECLPKPFANRNCSAVEVLLTLRVLTCVTWLSTHRRGPLECLRSASVDIRETILSDIVVSGSAEDVLEKPPVQLQST